nr:hypothetical protein [Tanacetum cinerariifolium]
MSTSTHPIIIVSDSDVEDTFSSKDYTSASPDYSPATPGNTSSDFETKQTYYANNEESFDSSSSSTIPPPPAPVCPCRKGVKDWRQVQSYREQVLPSSPLYHPRDFVPEEIMPPQKRARFLSPPSSSTDLSASPQRDFDRLETELQEARNQIVRFQREKMRHDDEVVFTRVKISNLEVLIENIQIHHRSDIKSLLDTIHELKNHKGGPSSY